VKPQLRELAETLIAEGHRIRTAESPLTPRALSELRIRIRNRYIRINGRKANRQSRRAILDRAKTGEAARALRSGGLACSDEAFTPRQKQVLGCILQGLRHKETAARLGLSERVIKFHVAHLLAKSGKANCKELVSHAFREREGFVDRRMDGEQLSLPLTWSLRV
jgi:DNA-binding CsgD family transcriptional regulator